MNEVIQDLKKNVQTCADALKVKSYVLVLHKIILAWILMKLLISYDNDDEKERAGFFLCVMKINSYPAIHRTSQLFFGD